MHAGGPLHAGFDLLQGDEIGLGGLDDFGDAADILLAVHPERMGLAFAVPVTRQSNR